MVDRVVQLIVKLGFRAVARIPGSVDELAPGHARGALAVVVWHGYRLALVPPLVWYTIFARARFSACRIRAPAARRKHVQLAISIVRLARARVRP
eukprot:14117-Pelagococcus_subviridis.AAC.1